MHSVAEHNQQIHAAPTSRGGLAVELAAGESDVRAFQLLRYEIFAGEMGARLDSEALGLDTDHYDAFCHHLIVRDRSTGAVVGGTRILTDTQARLAGGFYSENEFDMSGLLPLGGRVMEIGRTCIHPEYRGGAAIAVLWSGLARFMSMNGFDYLMGCASISMADDGLTVETLMQRMREHNMAPDSLRVYPRRPVPITGGAVRIGATMPPLLKAYLRLGCYVCGEPCWDPEFNVADVFVLLDRERLNQRYHRHFVERALSVTGSQWSHQGLHA